MQERNRCELAVLAKVVAQATDATLFFSGDFFGQKLGTHFGICLLSNKDKINKVASVDQTIFMTGKSNCTNLLRQQWDFAKEMINSSP